MLILSLVFLLLFLIDGIKACQDLVPCGRAIGYCNAPHLVKTMSVNCPLTCGFCQPTYQGNNGGYPNNGGYNNGYPNNGGYNNGYPNAGIPNQGYPNQGNGQVPIPNPAPANPNQGNGQIPQIPITNPNPAVNPSPAAPPVFNYPKFKLHYFNIRFRAEPIRMMFHYKSIPFDDIRIKKSKWDAQTKAKYIDGQLPMLEIDNQRLSQSMAIYRYVGRKLGMFGANEGESAYLDYIAELWREFIDKSLQYKRVAAKVAQGNENDLHDNVFIPALQQYAPKMEKLLDNAGSGFFGGTVSWIDFYVAGTFQTFMFLDPTSMLAYTKLSDHNQRIYKLPELQAYLKKHPPVSVL